MKLVLLRFVPGLALGVLLTGVCVGVEGFVPEVVLEAEGDLELAPHGEGNVYAPDVHRDGGLWKMWYGGQGRDGHDRIFYAESRDGLRWLRKGVALEDPTANHVNDPAVVKVRETWYMLYTRAGRDIVDRLHVATSRDGRTWEPKGQVIGPGERGAWDALSVGRPALLYEDGLFKMWYDGRKDFPLGAPAKGVPTSPTSRRSVGYATSRDGLRWMKYKSNPVFEHDAGGVDVKRVGKKLVLLYESREGTKLAVGTDGISWRDGGVLLRKSGFKPDAFGHVTPCLVPGSAGEHRLYFGASSARSWDRNRIAFVPIPATALQR